MSRLHSKLAKLLPAGFDRQAVIQTEKLDAYDLLDPMSSTSKIVQTWLDNLPDGALLVWRPPRRPWVVIVPASEVEGREFEFGIRFAHWMIVGLEWWLNAGPTTPQTVPEETHYYSSFHIEYQADVYVTQGDDQLTAILAKALSRVPTDVVDRALEGCRYLMVVPQQGGCYIPASALGKRDLVLLPHSFFDESEEEQINVILHETAHFIRQHKSPLYDFDLDYDAQEQEANELVEEWLGDWKTHQAMATIHQKPTP
jgi:hypothetical protein